MATMDLNSVTISLAPDLLRTAEDLPQLRKEILQQQADIVEPALKSGVTSSGLVDTGQLRDSIGRSTRKGGKEIIIGPSGERAHKVSRSGRVQRLRNGHLGYIYEYGLPGRGIQPKRWMSNTISRVRGKTLNAAETVNDQFLKKHNL